MPTHNYSIIIPAYNEGELIPTSLEKVLSYVTRNFPGRAEIIVVNDGSTDGTADIVREYARRNRAVRLIENPENRGKGYSVRNGMLHASGDILLFSDADLSAPIGESERLFAALHAGADIAIGSRWIDPGLQIEHQPALREVLGRIFNLLLRIILRLHFKDTQCGFKAFTRRAADMIFCRQKIEGWGFDPELLFLADKCGLRVAEVAVEWAHSSRSKIHTLVDGPQMFLDMLRVRWNYIKGIYSLGMPATEATIAPAPALRSRAAAASQTDSPLRTR